MDFIILKVNGVDVSTLSTEEASLAFQNAAEPIVVQVLRRSSNNESTPTSPVSSAGPHLSPKTCLAGANCCLHGHGNNTSSTTTTTTMSTQTDWTTMADMMTDHVVVDDLDLLEAMYDPQDSDELFDELMDQEMEYEEVRLVRDNNQAKLGLTLCYTINCVSSDSPLLLNTDNNGTDPVPTNTATKAGIERSGNSPNNESPSRLTEAEKGRQTEGTAVETGEGEDEEAIDDEDVYIKEIAPDSVAAIDGRLKAGDQILQIDGEDVRNRATAERLFAAARSEILLLVSRPHQSPHPLEAALPGGAEDEEDLYFAEKSPLDLAEDLGVMESESHKDSGFGTGSLPQEEASGTSEGDDTGDKEINTQTSTDKHAISEVNSELDATRPESVLSLDTELYMLNKKMHDIQLECENMMAARQNQQQERRSPPLPTELLSPPSSPEKKPSAWGESETEHIYETIHELTEESDEPIYSTPYEVQIARQRALQRQQQLLLANLNSTNASRTSIAMKTRTIEPKKFTLDKKLSRGGFEKMDKTLDVEHWIRHATVNPQPCDPTATKGLKTKPEDLVKQVSVVPTSPVKTSTGKNSVSKSNTNERSWKGTNSTKISSSTSSSDSQYRVTGLMGMNTEVPKVAPPASKGRKHGSKGSASSGSGEDRDSSSAYNTGTGESFRSGQVMAPSFEEPPRGVYDNLACGQCESNNKDWRQSNLSLSVSLGGRSEQAGKLFANFQLNTEPPSSENCVKCEPQINRVPRFVDRKASTPRVANNGTVSDSMERNRNYVTMLPAHTMYTNAENLQQTIWLQQQLFKQTLQQQSSQDVGNNKAHRNGRHAPLSMDTIIEDAAAMIPPPPGAPPRSLKHGMFPKLNFSHYQYVSTPTEGVQTPLVDKKGNFVGYVNGGYPLTVNGAGEDLPLGMEWKVKKRTDGTRYITRKPARTRVLRDRALQINEERAGVTTDDDAMSEMKTGRYWSKDEKKQHLEKARERRKRQEEIIRAKMRGSYSYNPNEPQASTAPRNINIVELSHRKMAAIARQRRDNQIDDFTTVQEMLVHGNRVGQGLLSVTTV